jgi:hypothetical protein
MLVLPDDTFDVTGRILENGIGVPRMTVTVDGGVGQSKGTLTDLSGEFALYGVTGDIVLRVSRDGYETVFQPVTVNHLNTRAPDISVHQVGTPMDFSGRWRMTITPASSCTMLPPDIGSRSYDVTIVQSGASAKVSFAADDMFKRSSSIASSGHVTGATLEFTLATAVDGYYKWYSPNFVYDVMEAIDGNRFLGLQGNGRASGPGVRADGVFDGSLDLFAGTKNDYWSSGLVQRCTSSGHAVVMTK